VDLLGFGLIERPWDHVEPGPSGLTFGYFGVRDFDPEGWRSSYPNSAFSRMTERDAAWMARIIARLDEGAVGAMVGAGKIAPALHADLVRILMGRRRAILARFSVAYHPWPTPRSYRAAAEPGCVPRTWQ
jgi:hypothetical protein